MMITVPFIKGYVSWIGIELSIFVAALIFGFAFIVIGATTLITVYN